jgi:uncharacterized protein
VIRHLTKADYRTMPWANGLGQTTELVRVDRDGVMLWRLSVAQVVADGPFSRLPGVQRNLTVLTGPGFRLTGPGVDLWAGPLAPVAFDGGADIAAGQVTAPCEDFNVMVAGHLPPPGVALFGPGHWSAPEGGLVALLLLTDGVAGGRPVATRDLILCESDLSLTLGQALVVTLPAVGPLPPDGRHPTL